jgi:UDP-3-O-[3-hydroxymyristoyl] N-acetylglucosamine deacetylase/3-hydroxyacyl-[acyl-carrier-protein] dehydratase
MLRKPENAGKIGYFMSADNVKWRRPVLPGDTLYIEAEVIKIRGSIGQTKCRCLVGGDVASEAELKFALVQQ